MLNKVVLISLQFSLLDPYRHIFYNRANRLPFFIHYLACYVFRIAAHVLCLKGYLAQNAGEQIATFGQKRSIVGAAREIGSLTGFAGGYLSRNLRHVFHLIESVRFG